jgi:hypothetical protein
VEEDGFTVKQKSHVAPIALIRSFESPKMPFRRTAGSYQPGT